MDPQGLPLEVRFFARELGAAPEETTSLCYETDQNAHPFDILFYIVID